MDNDDDFTFCQVGVTAQDGVEAKKLASDIDGVVIKDESSTGTNGRQSTGITWKDSLPIDASSKKEETVGSLSFNVIDGASLKKSSDVSRQVASLDVGTSVTNSKGQKPSARKPAARAKVPFEKGYSQMDWLKLTRTHPDLAGLKGQSNKRLISMNEVKQHQSEGSMWTVLKGHVYNLSPYMKFHPGGVDMLMKAVGKDCTSLFNKYHAWVNAEFLMEKCLVGTLDESQ
ncbi:hypothetical protein P3X46_013161 [Hevea brasiliensis]|uniref:Cytochrome b5 heme-binding domain-containing protein n=1 Tax=Hevea brasiliensis TaxID=3981 RepID=A0ABQ9M4S1_HEVBR|nr:cytochrome b5 domain-containing protein RLF isoform X1 [Hevea brasiliensis]XP_021638892.2 cytochrome b5 domain-containing protein RLF isoform X1 [Hevea brasiliensis]KAJ9174525.1 hypothetical protein P3X46_013161 [Hevea brasiliensis]